MPILCFSFILITIGAINFFSSKASHKTTEKRDAFWAKEEAANATAKIDLSTLKYITLDERLFSLHFEDDTLSALEADVLSLQDKKILNLTGLSNTDVKLKYGAANLTILTQCDDNFTTLCTSVYRWGEALADKGHIDEAVTVLEYGIRIGTDVVGNYTLLARLYRNRGVLHKVDGLLDSAKNLSSLSKDNIILKLQEIVHHN